MCCNLLSLFRNLRHHIIRFHSDGSGRELLKRARKDKNQAAAFKNLAASSLKKAAVKLLNTNASDIGASSIKMDTNNLVALESNPNSTTLTEKEHTNDSYNQEIRNVHTSKQNDTISSYENENHEANRISSSRRRKGKPSKKVLITNESAGETEEDMGGEIEEDEMERNTDESSFPEDLRREHDSDISNENSDATNQSETEIKGRCHGAFFSSYNPRFEFDNNSVFYGSLSVVNFRLGIVEKPINRSETCRPLLGPDGKYLYPCHYCHKTFCSVSDLNRHEGFHLGMSIIGYH